jgi:molybdate transport system ATP-binding protein
VPIFYVTHALEDVVGVADTVITVEEGQITSNQTIEALASALPIDDASRTGSVLRCRVVNYDAQYDLTELKLGNSSLFLRGRVADGLTDVRVLVPARDVSLATQAVTGLSVLNQLPGTIAALQEEADGACSVIMQCDGQRLLSRITRYSRDHLALRPGQQVTALIKTVALATLH